MGNNQSVEEIDELTAEKLGLWYHDGYSPRPAKATLPRAFDSNASLLSAYSSHSSGTSEPWGWFTEDVEYRAGTKGVSDMAANQAAVQVTDEEEKAKVDKIAEAKDSGSGAKGDSLRDKREEKDFSCRRYRFLHLTRRRRSMSWRAALSTSTCGTPQRADGPSSLRQSVNTSTTCGRRTSEILRSITMIVIRLPHPRLKPSCRLPMLASLTVIDTMVLRASLVWTWKRASLFCTQPSS